MADPDSEQRALIAAIAADTGDHAAWLVYADWLLDRGDPRGEWIARGADEVTDRPPVPVARLLSPRLAEHHHRWDLRWWRGFIYSAYPARSTMQPTLEAVDALFGDPHVALLGELALVHNLTQTVRLWQSVLAEPRHSLRSFVAMNLGDGGANLGQLPNLARLALVGGRMSDGSSTTSMPVARLAHATLPELSACAISCPAVLTGQFELPALERLSWHVDAHGERVVFTARDSILQRPPPSLCALAIGAFLRNVHITELVQCRALAQASRLRWALNAVRELELVAADPAPFRHLAVLSVDGGFPLPRGDVDRLHARLEAALPATKLAINWDNFAR